MCIIAAHAPLFFAITFLFFFSAYPSLLCFLSTFSPVRVAHRGAIDRGTKRNNNPHACSPPLPMHFSPHCDSDTGRRFVNRSPSVCTHAWACAGSTEGKRESERGTFGVTNRTRTTARPPFPSPLCPPLCPSRHLSLVLSSAQPPHFFGIAQHGRPHTTQCTRETGLTPSSPPSLHVVLCFVLPPS